MRTSSVGLFCLLGLAFGLATNGCGGSGDSADNPGTYASALASCTAYCDAYVAAACSPAAYPTGSQCKAGECTPIPTTASVGCYSATKSWYDCREAQSDICGDTGCPNQATAALSACP